ncbi:MAG: hypothetical protein ABS939_15735 [Psychrobacillus sp.]
MIINIAYLLMGIIVGILIKYEIDIRASKKRIERRSTYLRTTAENSMKEYDNILSSLKGINESLQKCNKQKQKEV